MNDEGGFTLVELLAAMVAGSLLLASLSWIVGSFGRELRAAEVGQEKAHVLRVSDRLRELVEGALLDATVTEQDRLKAMVAPPQSLGAVGPVEMELAVERTGKTEALFSRFGSDTQALDPAVTEKRMLVGGFKSISFEYGEARPRGLPKTISIALTDLRDQTSRIVLEPRIDSDGSCRFDPISMTCRQ